MPADTGFRAAFKIELILITFWWTVMSNPHSCRQWATRALAPSTCACTCSAQLPAVVFSLESLLERLGALAGHTAGFAHEDLLEDVEPAAHANDEANPCFQRNSLAIIAEGQHGDKPSLP